MKRAREQLKDYFVPYSELYMPPLQQVVCVNDRNQLCFVWTNKKLSNESAVLEGNVFVKRHNCEHDDDHHYHGIRVVNEKETCFSLLAADIKFFYTECYKWCGTCIDQMNMLATGTRYSLEYIIFMLCASRPESSLSIFPREMICKIASYLIGPVYLSLNSDLNCADLFMIHLGAPRVLNFLEYVLGERRLLPPPAPP